MANVSDCNIGRESPQKSQTQTNFEPMDKVSLSTLKRNPKIEFNKTDLLKLLTYLEGELQARDIVIATLKSEKMRQYLVQNRNILLKESNDPVVALQRDNFAVVDQSKDDGDMYSYVNHQYSSLDNLVQQQKRAKARIAKLLKDAEIRHRKELELEIQNRKKFEKEHHRMSEILEAEKNRHKQIVLFLLAERKKIIMKYVEERKRSEDLAQILAEEKGRVDAMAEGLEEESKKSLQMEAELEKQLAQFYVETQQLKMNLAEQEKRSKELEIELDKNQKENLYLRQQITDLRGQLDKNALHIVNPSSLPPGSQFTAGNEVVCPTPMNSSNPGLQGLAPSDMPMTSIAKVVQPTATVSSVPVSGPMIGIARSVSPGQHVRYVMYSPTSQSSYVADGGKSTESVSSPYPASVANMLDRGFGPSATLRSATIANSPHPKLAASPIAKTHSGEQGGAVSSTIARKPVPLGRGVPPPVPPNKPVIPPKKDGMLNRKLDTVNAENANGKGQTTVRTAVLPTGKVKLPSSVDKHDDQVRNDPIADNPG